MKPLIILLLPLVLFSLQALAQGHISGQLKNKQTGQPLADAAVALLKAADSSLLTAVFSDAGGNFSFDNITTGNYRLHITYLGYKAMLVPVSVRPDSLKVAVGVLFMEKTGLTLNEVEIKEIGRPLTIKKDTLEFNAAAFHTRENAVIENLFRKLPGLTVERDGTIKIGGDVVKKVLVEGRPFFGDDPKLATKNLPADMVDKVQLIERKSTQRTSSANETEKVINITIKKERINDIIGRVGAGYGTEQRFNAHTSLNRFRESQQLSFLGSGNNINSAGTGEIGPGSNSVGGNGQEGISRNWNGGLNYSEDLSRKLKLQASYFLYDNRMEQQFNSARQNILPANVNIYHQDNHLVDRNTRQDLNLQTEYQADSFHTIILNARYSYNKGTTLQNNTYSTSTEDGKLINEGVLANRSTSAAPILFTDLQLNKRFLKPGRFLGIYLSYRFNGTGSNNYNRSDNLFIDPSGQATRDSVDQFSDIDNDNNAFVLRVNYLEPLGKGHALEWGYTFFPSFNSNRKNTFRYNALKGVYDLPDDSLSNFFKNTFTVHEVSIKLNASKKRYEYSLGLFGQFSKMDNINVSMDQQLLKRSFNLIPFAFFNYMLGAEKRLRLTYSGGVEQPSPAQLQPVPDNANPLYVQLGNPDLKPAFNNNINLSYSALNPATMRSLLVELRTAWTRNKIITATRMDSLGRQLSTPLNIDGYHTIGGEISNSFRLDKTGATLNALTTFNLLRDVSATNGVEAFTNAYALKQSLGWNSNFDDLLDISIAGSVQYNGVRYALQKELNTNFFTYSLLFDAQLNLPGGFVLGADIDYMLNAGRPAGYNLDVLMLNGYLGKSLFKNKQALLKLQGFDLLKQNTSIRRTTGPNFIEDTQATVLQRFFLLSFTWFLKPAGKK